MDKYNINAGAQGTASVSARPTSAFELHEQAASQTQDLVTRICNLADRLVGAVPEAVSEKSPGMPSALLSQLGSIAQATRQQVARAHEALNRIEAALP